MLLATLSSFQAIDAWMWAVVAGAVVFCLALGFGCGGRRAERVVCGPCGGTGYGIGGPGKCPACRGTGESHLAAEE